MRERQRGEPIAGGQRLVAQVQHDTANESAPGSIDALTQARQRAERAPVSRSSGLDLNGDDATVGGLGDDVHLRAVACSIVVKCPIRRGADTLAFVVNRRGHRSAGRAPPVPDS